VIDIQSICFYGINNSANSNQLDLFGFVQEQKAHDIVYDYFLLISLPAQINSDVVILKHKLNSRIPINGYNLFSVPHITLIKTYERSDSDDCIVKRTERALALQGTFKVDIQGVDFFKSASKRHIILKVERTTEIQQIHAKLREEFDGGSSGKNFNPHITIGKGISLNNFEKVAQSLNEFDYKNSFSSSYITLLRRTIHKGMSNRIVVSKYNEIRKVHLIT
jgi:2'-5' RNA ligase